VSLAALPPAAVPQSILGNSLWVAIIASIHIQIATFLTGASTLVVVSEIVSMVRGDQRHGRLAHGLLRSMAYTFSFDAAIPIFWVLFVFLGLWGTFFIALTRITFWVFIIEAGLFLAEIILLYTLYANWERLGLHRRARLGLLVLLNLVLFWQMFFIDVVASYMLTPNGGDRSQLAQILNPTDLPLDLHRTVGNIAWAGALVAAFGAVRYLRATRHHPEDVPFYDWVVQWGVLFAIGFTLFQPWIGYSYAKEVQLHAYGGWYTMMFGELSNVFLLQITLLGLIFILATLYLLRRLRASGASGVRSLRLALGLEIVATLLAAMPARFAWTEGDVTARHLARPFWQGGLENPIGTMIPNKIIALIALVAAGLWALTVYLRALSRNQLRWGDATRRSQRGVIALAVVLSMMMGTMGVIREHSRHPYLIYGEMTIAGQRVVDGALQPPNSVDPPR
jgi:cytochrome d ubiquinol oxidase subunit I